MLLILSVIVILTIYSIYIGKDKLNEFDNNNTCCLRGILALMIVASHISQYLDTAQFTPPTLLRVTYEIRSSAIFVVAEFFCLSAFGLMVSYKQKGSAYLKGFVSKKIKRLFLPLIPVVFAYQIYKMIEGTFCLNAIGEGLLKGGTQHLCPNIWFVFSIFFFYSLFYCLAKHITNIKTITIVIIVAICVYSIVLFRLGWGQHWYLSNFGLLSGVLLAYFEKPFREWLQKYNYGVLLSLLLIFIGLCILANINFNLIPFTCGFTPILVYAIICKMEKNKNKFLTTFGQYSYEIYISHGVLIIFCSSINAFWLFVFTVVLLLFPISVMVNRIAASFGRF